MADQKTSGKRVGTGLVASFLLIAFSTIVGCADEKPKPMQQPSPEQVKGSADRSFDRLKQEERERKAVNQ